MEQYLVIGASSDVGVTFLKLLNQRVSENIHIYAHYKTNKEPLVQLSEQLDKLTITPIQADLSDDNQLTNLVQFMNQQDSIDKLIYLAADKLEYCKLKKLKWEKLLMDMNIQVRGLYEICKVLLPKMAAKKNGKVVIMLSECTIGMPPKFMTDYTVCKYAMLGLMKSLAMEFGGKGININGLSPSMMDTKFLSNIDERIIEMNAASSITGRNITKEEVAEAIYFLTSIGSDYMNGVNLNLTGGKV